MGKDLRGKELGKGLTQDKTTKYYTARFVDKNGKRQTKHFKKLQEARQWIADARHIDESTNTSLPREMTVDAFFEYWADVKLILAKKGTAELYRTRYYKSIQPYIGDMKICDVKANNCDKVIADMINAGYAHDTIGVARSVLNRLFDYAVECDIIPKSPSRIHLPKSVGKANNNRDAMTRDEQMQFLNAIDGHIHENQFRFVLQTGIRQGELIALKFSDVDFEKRTVSISRSASYKYDKQIWRIDEPKSRAGKRTIPLTDEAIEILKMQKQKNDLVKSIPEEWKDYIFINKFGVPIKSDAYYGAIKKVCKKIDIKNYSMHSLRHSFATRCIEGGMKPKTLQTLMGHSTIAVTMDLYVHSDEDELLNEMNLVSNYLNGID